MSWPDSSRNVLRPLVRFLLVVGVIGCATAPATQSPTPASTAPSAPVTMPSSAARPSAVPSATPSSASDTAWRRVPSDPAFTDGTVTHLAAVNRVVAVGQQRDQIATWFSDDGLTWQRGTIEPSDGARMLHVSSVGPDWMAAGFTPESGGAARLVAWTSPDGITWVRTPDSSALSVPDGWLIDVFTIHPPDGGYTLLARTCRPDGAGDPDGCQLVGFAAADRKTWRRLSLPALPGWVSAVDLFGLSYLNGMEVALGMACEERFGNPPCAYFALSSSGGPWNLTMSAQLDESFSEWYAGSAAASGGQTGFMALGRDGAWLFDPATAVARTSQITLDPAPGTSARLVAIDGTYSSWYGLSYGWSSPGSEADAVGVLRSPDGTTWSRVEAAPWTEEGGLLPRAFALASSPSGLRAVVLGDLDEVGDWGIWTLDLGVPTP